MEEGEDCQDQVGLRRLGLDDKIVRIRLGKKVEGWKREKIFIGIEKIRDGRGRRLVLEERGGNLAWLE